MEFQKKEIYSLTTRRDKDEENRQDQPNNTIDTNISDDILESRNCL